MMVEQQLKDYLQKGLKMSEMAKDSNIDRKKIKRLLEKFNLLEEYYTIHPLPKKIAKEDLEKLLFEKHTVLQISEVLGCRESVIKYNIKKYSLQSLLPTKPNLSVKQKSKLGEVVNIQALCRHHGETEFQWYYDTYRCKKCRNQLFKEQAYKRQHLRKAEIEAYKPRICSKCGFKEIKFAIEYHHVNPDEKSFDISQLGAAYSWVKVKEELDKCIPLCANCHREEHNPPVNVCGHKWACKLHMSYYDSGCKGCAKQRRNWYNRRCKQSLVRAMGNSCSLCKKQVSLAAYDFHHLFPENKEYAVGNLITTLKYNLIAYELSKCVLLCANCHVGVESGEYRLEKPVSFSEDSIREALQSDCCTKSPQTINQCPCGKTITRKAVLCRDCMVQEKILWPTVEDILESLRETSYVALGKQLGVSDNAIRKHLKKKGIAPPKAKNNESIDKALKAVT